MSITHTTSYIDAPARYITNRATCHPSLLPPKSHIDKLPTEILCIIFRSTRSVLRPETSAGYLPLEIVISHVCRRWRSISLNFRDFWTTIIIRPRLPHARIQAYLSRSGGAPLGIYVDYTVAPRDKRGELYDSTGHSYLIGLMSCLHPSIHRWHSFEFTATVFLVTAKVAQWLSRMASAPNLRRFAFILRHRLHAQYSIPLPWLHNSVKEVPFHGNAPSLRILDLEVYGADWNSTFLSDLYELRMAYHHLSCRPSPQAFLGILERCPDLHTLTLISSGPALANTDNTSRAKIQPAPALRHLTLHGLSYYEMIIVLERTTMPALLTLDIKLNMLVEDVLFHEGFVGQVVRRLAPRVGGLHALRIRHSRWDFHDATRALLDALGALRVLVLEDCAPALLQMLRHDPGYAPRAQAQKWDGAAPAPRFCPNLRVVALDSARDALELAEHRRKLGLPLSKIILPDSERAGMRAADAARLAEMLPGGLVFASTPGVIPSTGQNTVADLDVEIRVLVEEEELEKEEC
ncbi:hypothetical protein BC834DRAFT_965839 [Gloeopeniophorella convolvens]|nr:hypothetical protein BC834DRAFT_965839 [Gloeopeniophorella convolvens]